MHMSKSIIFIPFAIVQDRAQFFIIIILIECIHIMLNECLLDYIRERKRYREKMK